MVETTLEKIEVYKAVPAPDLLELQRDSFRWFLESGLPEELRALSPIKGYEGKLELSFSGKMTLGKPKYSARDCLIRETTFAVPLKVDVRLLNKQTKEVKTQDVFIGDLPMMTERGTFIINGAERVIVSQLVRSPGVYYRESKKIERIGKTYYYATVIPDRGSWLEVETDAAGTIFARINRTRKLPITMFLAAIGCSEKEILAALSEGEFRRQSLKECSILPREEALIEVYKKLRPGDPVTQEGASVYLNNLFFNARRYDLGRVGRYKMNRKLGIKVADDKYVLTKEDILAMVDHLIKINCGDGIVDDIDHLGNRRVRAVGELLQRHIRIGFSRIERLIKEQMMIRGGDVVTPGQLINIRPLQAVIKEFFGSSQLSQFMDQTNPLAEITHKRRLSALGPGGLSRERAGFEVRDIHPSHYGRVCPIETPEGPNAGLISSLSTYARVNEFGFIESPYRKVENGLVTKKIEYLTADVEDLHKIASYDVKLSRGGKAADEQVAVHYRREFMFAPAREVEYVGVAPEQIFGITTAMIPFLEHDDANRALMGANMQRQAVPLLSPEPPLVGTGLELRVARDSRTIVRAENPGKVVRLSAEEIVVQRSNGKKDSYQLQTFSRSNQDTLIHQRPMVKLGGEIKKDEIIADGSATAGGELALGRNVLVAMMPWEGYNYEDAILLSERLVKEDLFTSVHIQRLEVEVRATKLGMEELTREIPNISEDALANLDDCGVITPGAEVSSGQILVGKVTPKGETELPAEEKLLRAIFGDKARDMRDTSLRVPPGECGIVIAVRTFSRENGDELPPGVHELVRVYLAQMRKIAIGDKMAGRHGNKGVVAKVLPEEDMPYLPDGTPVDVILNPLGVPSRMNIGQIFELLLGHAGKLLNKRYKIPAFDESFEENASVKIIEEELTLAAQKANINWLDASGKVELRDGRTGRPFGRKIAIGYMYLMKLIHLVDDKMHARSTGPYSLITQQPLGGKAQFGGQRFGEMEVWALEAYGAAHTLQELLTVKSDDVVGRSKVYEAIIKGKPMGKPGTPESFKVLVKELRSLGLDVKTLTKEGKEINMDEQEKATGRRMPRIFDRDGSKSKRRI
ncbi:DNA-directed RNA polymerase subunit beta [Candidatus Saganbacteria bacterium CG08_land_8_20_14_0_20_45_16]|uniref:DNA-directed RNA polymerase subunit beta n=1 Tax=Candidatus Saganbacteria bacterium CG08_land_8_20_14_0_20_45_16 TaxID=2014293 RepID=A0A2H0XZI4_UNCSA|nr:MAG: DNA-directed RNA polymerase subunit beta [Candidatus Saganbacteria bacterium CG08_land_8_20_14_0_20_45_16]